jgi:hypothetical protein
MTDVMFQIRKNFDDFEGESGNCVYFLSSGLIISPNFVISGHPYFYFIRFIFDNTLVCHFINDGYRKNVHYYFPKLLSDFLIKRFHYRVKNKSFPGIFVQFFCCEGSRNFFLKSGFWRKILKRKKQRNFLERDSQDFRIHLFVHTSVIAKSSSLDNFISFSC